MILLCLVLAALVLVACWFATRGEVIGAGICMAIALGAVNWVSQSGDDQHSDERTAELICTSHRTYQGCDAVLGAMQREEDESAAQEQRAKEAWLRDYLKGKQR